jgi:hypothetical protein
MYAVWWSARGFLVRLIIALALAAPLTMGAEHAFALVPYVDSGLPDLKPEEQIKVSHPRAVQLLFQFQTKGTANARATKVLIKKVTEAVQASGLFTTVLDGPADGGAVLSITLNNVPSEHAAANGFVTGLTFGLKGSMVADYYLFTLDYIGGPDAAKITKTLRLQTQSWA